MFLELVFFVISVSSVLIFLLYGAIRDFQPAIDDREGETSCVPDFSGAIERERYSAQQDGHRISVCLRPSSVDTLVSRQPFEINV